MEHDKASTLLSAYAAGELAPDRKPKLEAHIQACVPCREWVDTYRFFQDSLGGQCAEEKRLHPSCGEIAHFISSTQSLDRERYGEILDHLEECETCHAEVELGRCAVADSRSGAGWRTVLPLARLNLPRVPRRALAAGLVASLIGLAFLVAPKLSRPSEDLLLSGRLIEGRQVLEAQRALMADSSHIESGADVRFRAGEAVAFGEGFSVGSGVDLVVELVNPNESAISKTLAESAREPKETSVEGP